MFRTASFEKAARTPLPPDEDPLLPQEGIVSLATEVSETASALDDITLDLGVSTEPETLSRIERAVHHNRRLILAFCMASHARVGSASAAQTLSGHLREKIVRYAGLMVVRVSDHWAWDTKSSSKDFTVSADGHRAERAANPGTDLLRGNTPLGPGVHRWVIQMSDWGSHGALGLCTGSLDTNQRSSQYKHLIDRPGVAWKSNHHSDTQGYFMEYDGDAHTLSCGRVVALEDNKEAVVVASNLPAVPMFPVVQCCYGHASVRLHQVESLVPLC